MRCPEGEPALDVGTRQTPPAAWCFACANNKHTPLGLARAAAAMSIYRYLLAQPADDINSLYRSPWCALAVYQSLDGLSKQCV